VFVGCQSARTEAVHSEDVHDVARDLHAAFFAAPLDEGKGSRRWVEGPGSDRGINPHPSPLSLAKGEATKQHPTGVPFHVRIQPIKDEHVVFRGLVSGLAENF